MLTTCSYESAFVEPGSDRYLRRNHDQPPESNHQHIATGARDRHGWNPGCRYAGYAWLAGERLNAAAGLAGWFLGGTSRSHYSARSGSFFSGSPTGHSGDWLYLKRLGCDEGRVSRAGWCPTGHSRAGHRNPGGQLTGSTAGSLLHDLDGGDCG